ncbi:MAG TPA: AMP-binding protein [Alphaproteobacteria bacterium]|nr:AMP-binding protein [Alphaproteobacteria bacterium]
MTAAGCCGAIVFHTFKSTTEGLVWPAIGDPRASATLAMQFQLEQTQWWPGEVLRAQQFRQLGSLLRHAAKTVPFYRPRFADAGINPESPLDEESWSRIPLLTRRDIQTAGDALVSQAVPKAHGKAHTLSTSGSTGMPVTVRGTQLTQFFWLAFTLRDQLWHGFDVTKKLAAIRHNRAGGGQYPDGAHHNGWGPATDPVLAAGPSVLLAISTPVEQQIEWLQRENPEYLITYPSNLMALLVHCRERKIEFPNLRCVETLSEVLHPDVRKACREVWGVKVVDMYSTQEVGYIALQCPEHEHYHIQSENALVEVLDEEGRPCKPGETGRMVVTPLHNFAMPLIRYAVGDYAVTGDRCSCGRGLPVITRVLGRVRNMLTLPGGAQLWPYFGGDKFAKVAPVSQYQIVQKTPADLEVRVVATRPLTAADEDKIRAVIAAEVGAGFAIAFTYHDAIERSKSGKFEDFRSELAS